MESTVSKELDYKKLNYIHPTYRMTRIFAQSGATTQTISSSGGQENIYEIPIAPFNLYQSYFTFTALIPETRTAAPVNYYNFVFRDVFSWWRQFQIYTRGGIYLMDLNELSNYTKVVWKAEINTLEFLDLDTDVPGATTLTTLGAGAMLQRSNAAPDTKDRPTGSVVGGELSSASSIAYTENKYLTTSAVANGAQAGALYFNIQFPLKLLKNTICAVDKDIYLGEILQLRIVWNALSKITFAATSNDQKYTGATNALTNNISISNMALYLATEKNQSIINNLVEKVSSGGIQMLIPYVYTYKSNLTGSSVSTSLRFNRGHGKNLQKIYYAMFNGAETTNTAYDNDNLVLTATGLNTKINYYYTLLNNQRIQEYNMQCNQWDDYKLLREKLKGSITQNSNIYNYNQFWVDDFCNYEKLWDDNSNLDSGLDLSVEQKWDIYITLATLMAGTAMNHYAFAVTQKVLTVSSTGVTVL